jgi:hypothetical protein
VLQLCDSTRTTPRRLVGLSFLIATLLFSVPLGGPVPVPGLDPSWRLAMNTFEDLQFGRDILFTYGPWGFLDHPMITDRSMFAVALLARVCVITALWVVSTRSLTRVWPLWVAAPVTTAFVVLVSASELSALTVAITAQYVLFHALDPKISERPRTGLIRVACLGALAAVVIQVKFSNGIALCALTALAVLTTTRLGGLRRFVTVGASAAGGFVAMMCVAWLARGQSLSHLGAWVRGSLDLTSGYPEAMGFEFPDAPARPYVVAVLLGLLVLAAAVPGLRHLPRRLQVGVLLVLGVAGGFAFKSAFTRHDPIHEVVYFVILISLFVGIVGTSRWGSWLAATGAALTAASLVAALTDPIGILAGPDPAGAADRWRTDLDVLTSAEHQTDRLEAARAAMIASHQLPPSLLEKVQDKPVSIEPSEASTAWAYGLDWRPAPVFQLYSAYTPALDGLNAAAMREAPARQRVLRHAAVPIDGRNPLWDSPRYQLALSCHYRVTHAEGIWTLLAKSRNRCGTPESSGESHVSAGTPVEVPVPPAGHLQLVRFTPDPPSASVHLGRALVKPFTHMFVTADGVPYQLSRESSPSGVLVTYPAVAQGVHAPLDIRTLVFSESGTLEFVSIPTE